MNIDLDENELKQLGPYSFRVTAAILFLGQIVEEVLNLRDIHVLKEMQRLCGEIFEQALNAYERNDLLQ
jgi:hypothetical protein